MAQGAYASKSGGMVPLSKNVAGRAGLVLAAVDGIQKVYGSSKQYWRDNFAYTVTVSEKDALYADVHDWLVSVTPREKHRSLMVSTSRVSNDESGMVSDSPQDRTDEKPKPLVIRFNESSTRTIMLGPHKVQVSLQTPDLSQATGYREIEPSKIQFLVTSHKAQQAVLDKLAEINASRKTNRKAILKMVSQWGNWTTRSDIPPRTMASVALPDEQKTRIVEDLREFLESEDRYNELAIPWHRAYMFEGPPGTGKTSLAKALANEFNLDLWYISLSDLKGEASLMSLISGVGPRSLLLLEDIDTVKITHDRDSSDPGVISMSSLLNALDGVATPHGLVTLMSTNRFDILDPALTRAGRMDMVEKIDYPTVDTLSTMFKHFYKTSPNWRGLGNRHIPIQGLSTSTIAEIMKRHMRDSKAASEATLEELKKYI